MSSAGGFGLYVHWPFCQAKCPYCDFNSHVSTSVDQTRWRRALVAEIQRSAAETGPRIVNSIFFGGGTPSLMPPETIAAVIGAARASWTPSNTLEITLEANPTSVEVGRFRAYADAGVNRVSIGVQSLNDDDLRALGRLHSAAEARAAVEIAQGCFDRVSFDLIYARQDQSVTEWKAELSEALSMASGHISLYQLTIEDGTAFGERFRRGSLKGLPNEDLAADLYDVTQDLTSRAGYPNYEISNHAHPSEQSVHNLIYWRSGDWVGVGPGAHGRISIGDSRIATEARRQPNAWLCSVETRDTGECARLVLSEEERSEEAVMMGLRLAEGLRLERVSSKYIRNINGLVDMGLLEHAEHYLRATPKGRPVLNYILREILT